MLEELGARVVLHAPLALVALLSTMEGNVSVVEEGHSIAGVDLQCPIMSLPRAFKTTIDTIPARVPYLAVPPEKQAYWRERLGRSGKRRVGLAWSGKANRNIDLNPATSRSVPLRLLAPLLQLPLELHSLQKETLESDADILSRFEQIRTHHGELNDFSDAAALVEEMDLVISIDTAVAHLAGALAKPLWMMLPYSSDYRWGIGGDRTPWYPAARLFRQSHISDWEGVVWRVASELAGMQ